MLRVGAIAIETPRVGLKTFDEQSFALHAPLELLARYALLPKVRPEQRKLARLQLLATAAVYQMIGEPGAPPSPWYPESMTEAWPAIIDAFDRGDQTDVERGMHYVAERATAETIIAFLGDRIVKRLGASLHAPILLALLCRVGPEAARLVLPKLWEFLGVLSVETVVDWCRAGVNGTDAAVPFAELRFGREMHLGTPREGGIVALVKHVAGNGALDVHLDAVASLEHGDAGDYDSAFATLTRLAALSMLQETSKIARYGWSHCLTIPEGIWSMSRCMESKQGALSLASAVVGSYRSVYGSNEFQYDWIPSTTTLSLSEALSVSPDEAAAAAFHAPSALRPEIETELATQAAIRNDTHLVKYTLTCLNLGAMDPEFAALYHAAAANLLAIWFKDTPEESLYANLLDGRV